MARKNTKKRMRTPQAIELPQDGLSQALTLGTPDGDALNDDFFSDPPPASEHTWDEVEERPKISRDKRRAMIATITIFSVFALAVGGFTIYTKLIMPTPVTLGASSTTFTLPQAPVMDVSAPAPAPMLPTSTPLIAVPSAPVPAAVTTIATEGTTPEDNTRDTQPVAQGPIDIAPTTSAQTSAVTVATSVSTRVPRTITAPRTKPAPSAEPNSLASQAMRALNSGDARQARQLAQQATQVSPERADGWIVLGAAHDALGDHAAALTAYATCTARAFGPRVATCRALAR